MPVHAGAPLLKAPGAARHHRWLRRRRALEGLLRRLAPERAVDVERALDADRVEILVEPGLGVLAAEVAQFLQEGPGDVEFGRGVEALEPAGAADAVEALETVVVAVEHARADEPRDEIRGAQLGEQARIEGDFIQPVRDLFGRPRNLQALDRVDLNND